MMKGQIKISPSLMRLPDGIAGCIEVLRYDDAPESIAFIEKYDQLPSTDILKLSLEEIVVWAGISTKRFIGLVTSAKAAHAQDVSKLIMLTYQPLVIETTARLAVIDEGGKDREMFHKATGFLPQPKGIELNFNQQNNGTQSLGNGKEPACLAPPSADSFLLEINSTLKPNQKQLEAPDPIVIANVPELEAEYEDMPI